MTCNNKFEIRCETMYLTTTGEAVWGEGGAGGDTWASYELLAIAEMPDTSFLFFFIKVPQPFACDGKWTRGEGRGWFGEGGVVPVAPPPGRSPTAAALMDWTTPQVLIPIKLLASLIKRKCCHGTPADSEEGGREQAERKGVERGRSEGDG